MHKNSFNLIFKWVAVVGGLLSLCSCSEPLSDQEFVLTKQVEPVYPESAQARGIQGYCIVDYTVTAQGNTEDIQIVDSSPTNIFDESCLSAIEQYSYQPRILNGKARTVKGVRRRFTFKSDENIAVNSMTVFSSIEGKKFSSETVHLLLDQYNNYEAISMVMHFSPTQYGREQYTLDLELTGGIRPVSEKRKKQLLKSNIVSQIELQTTYNNETFWHPFVEREPNTMPWMTAKGKHAFVVTGIGSTPNLGPFLLLENLDRT